MRVPWLLFLASLAALATAFALPGLSDLVLLTLPCAIASLILLLRARLTRAARPRPPRPWDRPPTPRAKPKVILIDGSNVMHWKDGTPKIETLREVVVRLTALGFTPGVVFDANAGYLITGRFQRDHELGAFLDLPTDRVMVVDKGTPADPTLLAAARDLGARIVTNDRYRDWAEAHPEVRTPGFLIRGGYRDNRLWLDVDTAEPPPQPSE